MKTDIIVPIYNQLKYTKLFIESLFNQKNFRLIIIDNGSDIEMQNYLKKIQKNSKINIEIIWNKKNLGYVKAINQGLKICTAESILLTNNDCIFTPNLILKLQEGLKFYDIVGPLSNNISNSEHILLTNYTYTNMDDLISFSKQLEKNNRNQFVDVDYLFGHCLLMKKEVYDTIGGLDERFGIGNYEDVDYCKRASLKGFKIGLRKDSFVYHFCHTTFNSIGINIDDLLKENKKIFDKKWK